MNPWLLILNLDAEPECPCCGEPCEVDAPDGLHPEAWCATCDLDALGPEVSA